MQNIKTLRAFENRMPRGMFECKLEEVARELRKQHSEELRD
jgi:hypothetical protein